MVSMTAANYSYTASGVPPDTTTGGDMVLMTSSGEIVRNGGSGRSERERCSDQQNCFVCGIEVKDDWPAFRLYEKKKVLCMGCEGKKIEVWRVSLPGDAGGYIDHDFNRMSEGLVHIDLGESLEVHKEEMEALRYLAVPEFEGLQSSQATKQIPRQYKQTIRGQ